MCHNLFTRIVRGEGGEKVYDILNHGPVDEDTLGGHCVHSY